MRDKKTDWLMTSTISFVFNKYDVACYAAGAIEVVVKLEAIE